MTNSHYRWQTPAVVTLWGKFVDALDADRLQRWSNDEPVMILFVGISEDEFHSATNDPTIKIE